MLAPRTRPKLTTLAFSVVTDVVDVLAYTFYLRVEKWRVRIFVRVLLTMEQFLGIGCTML